MTKLKKWTGIFLCAASWTWLYGYFLRLEANVEPQMFANGQGSHWWGIVLLYWIADTAIALCLAWLVRKPWGFRLPADFPFFQYAADVFVVMLLVHLAWLCTDHQLYPSLYSAGLASLPRVFIYLLFAWGIVMVMKYRQLVGILRLQAQGSPVIVPGVR
jgi:hypothetical protein